MSDREEMDVTPSTEVLYSWRSQRLTFAHVFGELIDNSFDAGATHIEIDLSEKNRLVVSDNGNGCPDMRAMLTAGRHLKQSTTKLGRFGVGFKDSAIWLGGITRIRSVNKGVVRSASANWDEMARSGRWKLPPASESPADPGECGTRLTFSDIERSLPAGKSLEDLIAEIGFLFTPAMKNRRGSIEFIAKGKKRIAAAPFSMPRLESVVDSDIHVGNKRAHVHVGLVPEGEVNPRPGISYTHGFRVIYPATGLGCGGRPFSRLCGWVSLDGEWRLNKNKDGVNIDEDALGDAVFDAIRDVVELGARRAMSVKTAALSANLTAMVRGMFGTGDAARDKTGEKPGTVDPSNSGKKHRNATKARPGETRRTVSIGRLNVDFKTLPGTMLGEVDTSGNTVWLADNHPFIKRLRDKENFDALVMGVMALIGGADKESQMRFKFFEKLEKQGCDSSFESVLGALLRDQGQELH